MDRTQTTFNVICNSGAKKVRLIHSYRRRVPTVGTEILTTVMKRNANSKVKVGQMFRAVVVYSKKPFTRSDKSVCSVDSNAVVLLQEGSKNPVGTRILGAVPSELKHLGFERIVALSTGTF